MQGPHVGFVDVPVDPLDVDRGTAEAARPAANRLRRERQAGIVHRIFPGGERTPAPVLVEVGPRCIMAGRRSTPLQRRRGPVRKSLSCCRGDALPAREDRTRIASSIGRRRPARQAASRSYQPGRHRNRRASSSGVRESGDGQVRVWRLKAPAAKRVEPTYDLRQEPGVGAAGPIGGEISRPAVTCLDCRLWPPHWGPRPLAF